MPELANACRMSAGSGRRPWSSRGPVTTISPSAPRSSQGVPCSEASSPDSATRGDRFPQDYSEERRQPFRSHRNFEIIIRGIVRADAIAGKDKRGGNACVFRKKPSGRKSESTDNSVLPPGIPAPAKLTSLADPSFNACDELKVLLVCPAVPAGAIHSSEEAG